MNKNLYLTVIGSIALFGLVVFWFLSPNGKLSPNRTLPMLNFAESNQSGSELETLKQQLAAMQEKLALFQDQQTVIDNNLGSLAQILTVADNQLPIQDDELIFEQESMNQEQVGAEFAADIMRYEERIDNEPIDANWSVSAETELVDGITIRDLNGNLLVQAECRATLCRVEMAFEDQNNLSHALNELPFLFSWDSEGSYYIDEDDPNNIIVYIAREGERLAQEN